MCHEVPGSKSYTFTNDKRVQILTTSEVVCGTVSRDTLTDAELTAGGELRETSRLLT